MPEQHRRLFIFIFALLVVTLGLLALRLKKAAEIVVKPDDTPIISPGFAPIPPDPKEYILGSPGAPLTATVFLDFSCAECRSLYQTLQSFVRSNPKNIRLIWKDAPGSSLLLKSAEKAHVAAWCAGEQGRFWHYADAIFADKNNWHEDKLPVLAANLKLDLPRWNACRAGTEAKTAVENSRALFKSLGLSFTPVLFVNNRLINLNKDINIEELLASFTTSL